MRPHRACTNDTLLETLVFIKYCDGSPAIMTTRRSAVLLSGVRQRSLSVFCDLLRIIYYYSKLRRRSQLCAVEDIPCMRETWLAVYT